MPRRHPTGQSESRVGTTNIAFILSVAGTFGLADRVVFATNSPSRADLPLPRVTAPA
jgi:hypothetical protein